MFPVEEAVRAHKALREAAGLGPEMFPVAAFVGMISDEVQTLRERGFTDAQIVDLVKRHSAIELEETELRAQYATPEERQKHR